MLKLKIIGPNQTEITKAPAPESGDMLKACIFFSYETPVACHVEGQGFFRTATKHSVTTSKHVNKWLDGAKASEKPQEFFDNLL